MSSVQLINGDCLEVLKTLDAGSIDAVVTDPPYGIRHSQHGSGASWDYTEIAGDEDTRLRDVVIEWAEAHEIPWAAFGTWKQPTPHQARGVLVWDKGPASGMGDLSFPWKMSWEEIAIGGQGWKGKRDEGVLRGHIQLTWESKGRKHPHQKPVSLMVALLRKLPNHLTILDPFMGSGTTGVACIQTDRNFIGIEIDATHFATAQKRIAAEQDKMVLFSGATA